MSHNIKDLVAELRDLEDKLREALYEQKTRELFSIDGLKIRFDPDVAKEHRSRMKGVWGWFWASRPQNILSAPFIYGMVGPMALYDLFLSLYQAICFPLYGIPKVRRSSYIRIDRHHLGYLNLVERLNCIYCGYGNGLLAYAAEITSRTEQYWCPIKHAHKLLGTHTRYAHFLDYGDAEDYPERLEEMRQKLREEA
ncbi:MAG: hypothetical protein GC160_29510 [Acidobacteria bacterium]|nr:hypothetical protein [Acidobacteriota bacterium]